MKRAWLILMALAAFAIVASVAWWLVARSSWRPPVPIKPALPESIAMGDFAAPQSKHTLEMPLFWSSRAPVEEGEMKADAAPASEIAELRLMAIFESGGQRVALLQRPDRSVLKLDSANPEGDWRLDAFDGLVATFVSTSGQRVERPLERVGATAAAPAARPVAPPRGGPGAAGGSQPPGAAAGGIRPEARPRPAVPAPASSGGLHPAKPAPAAGASSSQSPPASPPGTPPGVDASAPAGT